MMRWSWMRCGVVILLLGLGACQAGSVLIGAEDDGSEVEIGVGETLELVLPGNPSTGYAWALPDLDPAVLVSSGEPEFTPASGAIGADGEYRFLLKAIGEGTVRLQLPYERSWEDTEPLDIFTLTVVIR